MSKRAMLHPSTARIARPVRVLAGFFLFAGLGSAGVQAQSSEQTDGSAQAEQLTQVAEGIMQQSNDFRARNDLPPLTSNEQLTTAAEEFAAYMARTDEYSHQADGRTPAQRVRDAGYEDCVIRENLAYRQSSNPQEAQAMAEAFVQGWIDSEGHRENLLGAHVTETGVAVATFDQITYYAVQKFGRPRELSFEIEIRNPGPSSHRLTLGEGRDAQSVQLPPNGQVTATRCVPTTVSLDDGEQTITVDQSTVLEVVAGAGDAASLQQEGDQAEQ